MCCPPLRARALDALAKAKLWPLLGEAVRPWWHRRSFPAVTYWKGWEVRHVRGRTRPLGKAPSLTEVAALYEDSVGGLPGASCCCALSTGSIVSSSPRGSPLLRMQLWEACMEARLLASRRRRLQDVPAAVPRHIFHEARVRWQALQFRPPYLHLLGAVVAHWAA